MIGLSLRARAWTKVLVSEHALWFANGPEDAHEDPTFERNRSHEWVAREVKAVRENVGGIETFANFAKHEFKGKGARAYLDWKLAGYIPRPGRLTLSPMLTPKGKLYGDLTVACLAEDHFMLLGSGAMQEAHRRWFEKDLQDDVSYQNVSDEWHVIALSGPNARALLQKITSRECLRPNMAFRDVRQCYVGAVPVISKLNQLQWRVGLRNILQTTISFTAWHCGRRGRSRSRLSLVWRTRVNVYAA